MSSERRCCFHLLIWLIISFDSTGLQPYVSRDLMQFPVCIPGEGLMDVVVQSLVCHALVFRSSTSSLIHAVHCRYPARSWRNR